MRPTYEAPPRQVGANQAKNTWPLPSDGINVDLSRLMVVPTDLTRRCVRLPLT